MALRKGNVEKVIALDREPVVSMDRASLRQESEGRRTKLGERRRQALSRNADRARFWKSLAGVNYAGLTANSFVKTILDFQRWLFGSGQQGVEKRRAVAMERAERQRPPPVKEKGWRPVEAEEPKHAGEKASGPVPGGDAGKAGRDARIMKELAETDLKALDEAFQIREAEKILQERAKAREKERSRTKERGRERDDGIEM